MSLRAGIHRELGVRIAIVGSGISGLVCAYVLCKYHDVVVYEANDYIGGHTHTVQTPSGSRVDTGFIVFNRENYPNFCGLLSELGIQSQPTSMSFSARCDASGLEYSTSSLNHLFSQRKNLLNPAFYALLRDILRFNRQVTGLLEQVDEKLTVVEFLKQQLYSEVFARHFLYPISTALWSCPQEMLEEFPMRFILEFYLHHGMHKLLNQPGWNVVAGGSSHYVEKLVVPFRDRIRTSCPVSSVQRDKESVYIITKNGTERYDEVIFACHSDQSLRILGDSASIMEREMLIAFPYSKNKVTLHTDTKVLPMNKRAWASWNSQVERQPSPQAKVTYNMNMLQSLKTDQTFCVSLNQDHGIESNKVIERFEYEHPLFNTRRATVQKNHAELIRQKRSSFCGAYWGNGFHEAGVTSGLAVCKGFGIVPDWASQSNSSAGTAKGMG